MVTNIKNQRMKWTNQKEKQTPRLQRRCLHGDHSITTIQPLDHVSPITKQKPFRVTLLLHLPRKLQLKLRPTFQSLRNHFNASNPRERREELNPLQRDRLDRHEPNIQRLVHQLAMLKHFRKVRSMLERHFLHSQNVITIHAICDFLQKFLLFVRTPATRALEHDSHDKILF